MEVNESSKADIKVVYPKPDRFDHGDGTMSVHTQPPSVKTSSDTKNRMGAPSLPARGWVWESDEGL